MMSVRPEEPICHLHFCVSCMHMCRCIVREDTGEIHSAIAFKVIMLPCCLHVRRWAGRGDNGGREIAVALDHLKHFRLFEKRNIKTVSNSR